MAITTTSPIGATTISAGQWGQKVVDDLTSLDGRATPLESRATALEGRATSLEIHLTAFVAAAGTTTSAIATPTLTGSTVCGLAFTAPASGRVKVTWQADVSNAVAAGVSVVEWEIRTGSTVGSGTVTVATTDNDSIQSTGTTVATPQHHSFASGLTPGAAYNIQLMHYGAGGNTGTFSRRRITVEPA